MSVGSKWGMSGTGSRVTLLSAGVALGMLACTSEDSPTTPSASPTAASTTAAEYRAVDLGTLGGAGSIAFGINKSGQIVGQSLTAQTQNHAFLWSAGVMTDLGTLGGRSSRAFGIDGAGRIVGGATTAGQNGSTHAFLWTNGVMQDLGTLGGIFSEATAINAGGQVVGASSIGVNPQADPIHAFLWKSGTMTDLGTLGGDYSYARGINPLGDVVGESKTATGRLHAFLWSNGTMTDLGPTAGQAYGINRSGRVVGSTGSTPRATVWVNGEKRLWGPAGTVSAGFGVNAAGLVVGVIQASGANQAVLWNKGVATVLRTIGGDLVHGQAFAINADGEIAGESTTVAGDVSHATLWTLK
jgi:probable HAF family extracellular repeat protein